MNKKDKILKDTEAPEGISSMHQCEEDGEFLFIGDKFYWKCHICKNKIQVGHLELAAR